MRWAFGCLVWSGVEGGSCRDYARRLRYNDEARMEHGFRGFPLMGLTLGTVADRFRINHRWGSLLLPMLRKVLARFTAEPDSNPLGYSRSYVSISRACT